MDDQQQITIVSDFLLQSPPGQINDVLNGVHYYMPALPLV
jgi:hypothetical protein